MRPGAAALLSCERTLGCLGWMEIARRCCREACQVKGAQRTGQFPSWTRPDLQGPRLERLGRREGGGTTHGDGSERERLAADEGCPEDGRDSAEERAGSEGGRHDLGMSAMVGEGAKERDGPEAGWPLSQGGTSQQQRRRRRRHAPDRARCCAPNRRRAADANQPDGLSSDSSCGASRGRGTSTRARSTTPLACAPPPSRRHRWSARRSSGLVHRRAAADNSRSARVRDALLSSPPAEGSLGCIGIQKGEGGRAGYTWDVQGQVWGCPVI
jgi:hypothetical protein